MFAVVKTGGKQYRVAKDDVIRVEKLEAEAGDTVLLNEVLMISDENGAQTGTPMLPGAVVEAEVVEQTRNKKIIIFKKKRRQNYRRKRGHRQHVTVLRVIDIALDGSNKKATTKAKVAAAPAGDADGDPVGARNREAGFRAPEPVLGRPRVRDRRDPGGDDPAGGRCAGPSGAIPGRSGDGDFFAARRVTGAPGPQLGGGRLTGGALDS